LSDLETADGRGFTQIIEEFERVVAMLLVLVLRNRGLDSKIIRVHPRLSAVSFPVYGLT
jgi:hypothetical protein